MTPEKLFAAAVIAVFVFVGLTALFIKKPKKLKVTSYTTRWREIQNTLKDKKLWPLAIIEADSLLGEVLKKRKFKGANMGERMVSAQKLFSDHDAVWTAHKLRNKLAHGEQKTVKEDEVKKALVALRQALKDLGAL
ncbi:MAG: hypothetical protein M3Q79_01035 [bacterium]|nr:hypothetical protein [bacterium]